MAQKQINPHRTGVFRSAPTQSFQLGIDPHRRCHLFLREGSVFLIGQVGPVNSTLSWNLLRQILVGGIFQRDLIAGIQLHAFRRADILLAVRSELDSQAR